MSRPKLLKTKVFLDSCDPKDTLSAVNKLGFLDGQTTNPSLLVKNPLFKKKIEIGEIHSIDSILEFYKLTLKEIYDLIPEGYISVEVYADHDPTKDELLSQAKMMEQWINKPFIKFPTTLEGLEAGHEYSMQGGKCNFTLLFSQSQAAAVYLATLGAEGDKTFISPFVGRLDDIGLNGLDLVSNCQEMFASSDHHVEILAASVRTMSHFYSCLAMEVDIITAPLQVLSQWVDEGMVIPSKDYVSNEQIVLDQIAYQSIDLANTNWRDLDISHDLTNKGLLKFASDWESLI